MGNLAKRVISGVIGAFALIFMIYFSGITFFILAGIIGLLAFDELYRLFDGRRDLAYFTAQTINILLYISVYLVRTGILESQWVAGLLPVVFILPIIKLFQKNNAVKALRSLIFAFFYTTIPLLLFIEIGYRTGHYEYRIILGIFFLIWANDTGAYFSGKYLGKHKLFERISPKKTWEGSFGGLILSMVVAYVLSVYFSILAPYQWFGIAGITTVAGSLGDLVESMIKRSLNVKDSGNLIPGHGGILDRFDALLLCTPFLYLFLFLTNL